MALQGGVFTTCWQKLLWMLTVTGFRWCASVPDLQQQSKQIQLNSGIISSRTFIFAVLEWVVMFLRSARRAQRHQARRVGKCGAVPKLPAATSRCILTFQETDISVNVIDIRWGLELDVQAICPEQAKSARRTMVPNQLNKIHNFALM